MLRALRVCLVVLSFVLGVACVTSGPPTGETDPEDLNGGGGWEGSNCMGAGYGIRLRTRSGGVATVRQSTAIGVVVDAIELSAARNESNGVNVTIGGLEEFEDDGLRNWRHKIGETLLPDESWIASYDEDTVEYGRGHYNLLGLTSACQPIEPTLSPELARTLAMFLYALSQLASCPDPEVAEEDGNFVSVQVSLKGTDDLLALVPNAPDAPTIEQLIDSNAAEVVPAGAAPDPGLTCLLWDYNYDDAIFFRTAEVLPARCLLQGHVESAVASVERSEAPFDDGPAGPAGEPIAFAAKPVLAVPGALGEATAVRHLLADYHVGVITRINSRTTCDDKTKQKYGAAVDPCPANKARLHFTSVNVERRLGELPLALEAKLQPIFTRGALREALLVIVPRGSRPVCRYECPPESPSPSGEATCT